MLNAVISVIVLYVFMPSILTLSAVKLNTIMTNVVIDVIPSVIIRNVGMLNVVEPVKHPFYNSFLEEKNCF
jgi:hypothetical protein